MKEIICKPEHTLRPIIQVCSVSVNGLYLLEVDEAKTIVEFMVIGRIIYFGGKWDKRRKYRIEVTWLENDILYGFIIREKIRPILIPIM